MNQQPVSVVIKLLLVFCSCLAPICFASTVCDAVTRGEHSIQGVIIYPNGHANLFIAGRVFSFYAPSDIRKQGSFHSLTLKSQSVDVETYYPGVYLDGKEIFNVYGLFSNTSRNIFFIVYNEADSKKQQEVTSGFYYDLDERKSIVVDSASVPKFFPFVYFSDNENSVYLYQIPLYTFQARDMNALDGVQKTGYFGFNSMDLEMHFTSVDLSGDMIQKMLATMSGKLLLRSGFVYSGHVYLITKEDVYVLDQAEMQKDPMPKHVKMPIKDFLLCDDAAVLFPTNWSQVFIYTVIVILIIIVIVLCYQMAVGEANSKQLENVSRVSSAGKKSSKHASNGPTASSSSVSK